MCPQLRHRIIAFVLPAVLAAALLYVLAGAAAARRGVPPDSFRILFPDGASTPYQTGEHGERNRAAIQHMVRIFRQWSHATGIRFVFVTARSSTCNGGTGCSPEHLLWQRVNETAVLLRSAADKGKIRFDRIGQAFQDEFQVPPELLPVPPHSGSIELRMYVDADDKVLEVADRCPWRVLLFDPDLPAVIGDREGKPVIPILPGNSLSVGRQVTIRLARVRGGGSIAAAVWETSRGEFCSAASAVFSEEGAPIPPLVGRLHLLAPVPGDRDLQSFLADLTPECKLMRRLPLALQRQTARSGSRDMGDDIQLLPPGGLYPPRGRTWSAEHCHVTFLSPP